MTHLLLTSTEDGGATLIDLDNPNQTRSLRMMYEDISHGSDPLYDRMYVVDPKINDGTPTLCRTHGTQGKFDEDDYADAHVTVMLDQREPHIVHRFGYRIDGRA